jgi:hypothetical protein
VRFAFEGKPVAAYLRLPKGAKPAPLVFGINGFDSRKEDVIARVDDFLKHGDPKEVWVNPAGGHMGRPADWTSRNIFQTVVLPWIVRRLGAGA